MSNLQKSKPLAIAQNDCDLEQLEAFMLNEAYKVSGTHMGIDMPIVEHFLPGYYVREGHIPADTLVLGHEHRFVHLCLLVEGELVFIKGKEATRVEAPFWFVAGPGRKLGYTTRDTVFVNVFAIDDEKVDKNDMLSYIVNKSDTWNHFYKQLEAPGTLIEEKELPW